MNDSERVYSLLVHANPVPDPNNLPITQDEAQLLTVERSRTMDTQVRTERTFKQEKGWRVAVGFAAVLVIGIAGAFLLLSGGDDVAGSGDVDVTFTHTWYSATGQSEEFFTGPAVDKGLLCPASIATSERFEYPDGSALSVTELERLNNGTERFSYVAIAEQVCTDGSGSFTMRFLTDAVNPAAFETNMTWELVGGPGYEGLSGEGQNHGVSIDGPPIVMSGTNSGVVRRG